jgi:hypothetical protein
LNPWARSKDAVRRSTLGPRILDLIGSLHERDFERALTRRRQGPVTADLLYRVLLGRPATRVEQLDLCRRASAGESLMDLAHWLRASAEGSRVVVHQIGPALRNFVGGQFDPESGLSELPRLVFLHFMKVGGTSISDQLAGYFAEDRARVHMFLDDIALTPPPVLANLRVIAGHLPFAALSLVPPPFVTMAVLRDPFSRTLSHYSHMKTVNPSYASLTLEEFVFDEIYHQSGNYQARQLAFDMDVAAAWRRFSPVHIVVSEGAPADYDRPLAAVFDSRPLEMSDEELMKRARANLDRIDHVAATEQLDSMARVAARLFGRPPVPVGHLNKSPAIDRDAVDARIRRRIEERTEVDRALHEAALERGRASGD